jgi:hypothetical protein
MTVPDVHLAASDAAELAEMPAFPASWFSDGEELFGEPTP